MLTPEKLWGIYDSTRAEIVSVHIYEFLAKDALVRLYLAATTEDTKNQRYAKGTLSDCIDWHMKDNTACKGMCGGY